MVFGNPRPSHRKLLKGDIINMELAAGYNGMSAQIGSPITLGEPNEMVRRFWEDITLPGYQQDRRRDQAGQRRPTTCASPASSSATRACSRGPTQVHGIDIVTDKPHVFAERTEADEIDKVLKPGMIIMAEPNPITADGMFGIFLGHTFIVTADGHEVRRQFPAGDRRRAVLRLGSIPAASPIRTAASSRAKPGIHADRLSTESPNVAGRRSRMTAEGVRPQRELATTAS